MKIKTLQERSLVPDTQKSMKNVWTESQNNNKMFEIMELVQEKRLPEHLCKQESP